MVLGEGLAAVLPVGRRPRGGGGVAWAQWPHRDPPLAVGGADPGSACLPRGLPPPRFPRGDRPQSPDSDRRGPVPPEQAGPPALVHRDHLPPARPAPTQPGGPVTLSRDTEPV